VKALAEQTAKGHRRKSVSKDHRHPGGDQESVNAIRKSAAPLKNCPRSRSTIAAAVEQQGAGDARKFPATCKQASAGHQQVSSNITGRANAAPARPFGLLAGSLGGTSLSGDSKRLKL